MSKMIERVARAIAEADQEDYMEDYARYDKRAKAAIEAMYEPTRAMNKAAPLPYRWDYSAPPRLVLPLGYTTADAWRAMIDVALKD